MYLNFFIIQIEFLFLLIYNIYMNKQQVQIDYWRNNAQIDFESAQILFKNNKTLHSLFFCHLAIEKILKACFVKQINKIPPKTHNLFILTEKINLTLSEDDEIFLGILMKYQLEGRYPDYNPIIPDTKTAQSYLEKTGSLLEWLISKL